MKLEEINRRILKITLQIQTNNPELSQFIEEMPITVPDEKTPEISQKNLEDYLNSLILFLKKYEINEVN